MIDPNAGKLRKYEEGAVLIQEQELSRKMFVLHKGKVRVYRNYVGQKITLAILNEGEIFGEMSFFDAGPRSATVEAITPIEVYVIDAEEASRQIEGLPVWVRPILNTVFNRLRQTDARATIMQVSNEFEKKHFKRDSVAESLYGELLRFNRILLLINEKEIGKTLKSEAVLHGMDEMLGARSLSIQAYWRLLKEYGFLDREKEQKSGEVMLNIDSLKNWIGDLEQEISGKHYTLLSHSGLAVLKRIVAQMSTDGEKHTDETELLRVTYEDLRIEGMAFAKEGLLELAKAGMIHEVTPESLSVSPSLAVRAFTNQSMLKYFDHTVNHLG